MVAPLVVFGSSGSGKQIRSGYSSKRQSKRGNKRERIREDRREKEEEIEMIACQSLVAKGSHQWSPVVTGKKRESEENEGGKGSRLDKFWSACD